ncbi:MAG: regulatory protein RecX [Methylococcaceae bacterium]|nr:regulatory protein RecX [Prolixibacteraceae bacterium]
MAFSSEQRSAYLKATAICSRGETCSFDILEKLRKWGLEEAQAREVIDQLKAEKYIDDERFARAYVKDKFRFNHWGRQKIAYMLSSKRIGKEIQQAAFEEIEDESYSEELIKLIKSKEKSVKADDPFDKRNKLMRFAMARGFETDKIFKAFKELGI